MHEANQVQCVHNKIKVSGLTGFRNDRTNLFHFLGIRELNSEKKDEVNV